jgi:phosphatidylglycerophosphate synthase
MLDETKTFPFQLSCGTQALIVYPVYTAVEPQELICFLSLSFLLDLFDGPLARLLNQTSWLGGILDVICDNTGRWSRTLTHCCPAPLLHLTHAHSLKHAHTRRTHTRRTVMWLYAASRRRDAWIPMTALAVIALEWTTFLSVQLMVAKDSGRFRV